MADDEKAVTAEGQPPAEAPAANPPADRFPELTVPPRSPSPEPRSGYPIEWTASDARGPLVTAAERPEFSATAPETVSDGIANESHPTHEPIGDHPIPEHSLSEDNATAADPSVVASPEQPKKRSLLPIAAGVVIGALIGAGSAALVYSLFSGNAAPDPQIASLSARIDALEKRPDAQAGVDGLKGAVASLEAKVAELQKGAGLQKVAPAPSEAAPTPANAAPPPAAVDLSPLQAKIAALQTDLDALKTQTASTTGLQAKVDALGTDIAAAKTASAAAQAGLAGVAGQQKLLVDKQQALSDKVMVPALAVVADSLVQQIDQGQPYATQVDALSGIGADPAKIAILRQGADAGVPSAKTLAAKFEPLAEPIAATAHKAPPDAGFVDRLKSGMFSMVSVRSADDTSGTDLPSRVARIKTDLAHDDVADALATWDALPADAKAKGEAWRALAKTSADAMSAARALQHDAITALGAKKS